jgi:hypothetical protein
MALFAPKCDRCGNRTRNQEDDKPVCEECVQEMKLLVEASGEEKRLCPLDGQAMSKEIAHMLVIDRCPQCHGVWFDGGELERMKDGLEEATVMAMARGMTSPLI